MPAESPLLLFYPTSPVHVRDLMPVIEKLAGWTCRAIINESLASIAPGIALALEEQGIPALTLHQDTGLDAGLPTDASILMLGAVFEPFALNLLAWARLRRIPAVAVEEVAQLALNQNDINNYDAPFDRLFVASLEEYERFVSLGYPPEMLRISGLLANDRMADDSLPDADGLLARLGIDKGLKPIVYTTSPPRSRRAIHNKDDLAFRAAVLAQLAIASRRIGRPFVIKLHPNEDVASARTWLEKRVPGVIVIGREVPMDELLAVAAVLVNRGNSQTCLESALRGVPTIVVASGLPTLFHNAGGARVIEAVEDLPQAIARAISDGPSDVSMLKARHFHRPPESVSGLVARELSGLTATQSSSDEAGWNWLLRSVLFVGGHARAMDLARRLKPGSVWQTTLVAALDAHLGGRRDECIARWLECTADDPYWFFPHYELAHAYLGAQDYARAIDHAHRAIALHPPYHGLWHELPMRVVIMAALRAAGNHAAAAGELAGLETRALVSPMPELLIEKAGQWIDQGLESGSACGCMKLALDLIEEIPVNLVVDAQLRERSLLQLYRLAERSEERQDYSVAAECYALITKTAPEDFWAKYALARAELARGHPFVAARMIYGVSGIPGAARIITERALPDSITAMLAPFWPRSSGGILKSFRLATHAFVWLAASWRKTPRVWPNATALLLLLALFVLKHLARSLIGNP